MNQSENAEETREVVYVGQIFREGLDTRFYTVVTATKYLDGRVTFMWGEGEGIEESKSDQKALISMVKGWTSLQSAEPETYRVRKQRFATNA